jgi:hypothetical protein
MGPGLFEPTEQRAPVDGAARRLLEGFLAGPDVLPVQ